MKRKFIEYDLPLATISSESGSERSVSHGHASTVHRWWARRPLAASRATALGSLVNDPGSTAPKAREELSQLIASICPWRVVSKAHGQPIADAQALILREFAGRAPRVLDPFAGGGTIPLEAARLGCDAVALDYNPVAVLIDRATMEWPTRFNLKVSEGSTRGPLREGSQYRLDTGDEDESVLTLLLKRAGDRLFRQVAAELKDVYPRGDQPSAAYEDEDGWRPFGYIWARTVECTNPECRTSIPLMKSFWLANRGKKKLALVPMLSEGEVVFEIKGGRELKEQLASGFEPSRGSMAGGSAQCLACNQVLAAKELRGIGSSEGIGQRLVAVCLYHSERSGKRYRLPSATDHRLFRCARERLDELSVRDDGLPSIPNEPLPPTGTLGIRVRNYGMAVWGDLLNPRQQLAMSVFSRAISESRSGIEADIRALALSSTELGAKPENLADAICGYLGLCLGGMLDRGSSLTPWNPKGEKIDSMFPRHALPMRWDYVECNPLSGINGDWTSNVEWMLRFLDHGDWSSFGSGKAVRGSATELPFDDDYFDAVLTDPPYYDNVPYAALSDYFYVWLKRSVGEFFPDLFTTPLVPKTEEAIMEPRRHGNPEEAREFFESMLAAAFKEVARVLRPDGIACVVYAHKTTTGWEALLKGLVDSGLAVTGSWPIRTERGARPRAAHSAALASSIYMVCRKITREPVGFWNDIQPLVKARVEQKLAQFWETGLVRGGDFFISAIGPGMEHYSQYDRVETYDGQVVGVLELLQYIRKVATDFLVHHLLADASAESIDNEAQFYLTYRWTFLDNTVEFDDARRIAAAEGVDIETLWGDGGFVRKRGSNLSVLGPEKRAKVKKVENMVDGLHRACQLWQAGRKSELTALLAEHGWGSSNAFWQMWQAVAERLVEGDKEKQILEGLLLGRDEYARAGAAGPSQQTLEM